jgi:hypothetical protein
LEEVGCGEGQGWKELDVERVRGGRSWMWRGSVVKGVRCGECWECKGLGVERVRVGRGQMW